MRSSAVVNSTGFLGFFLQALTVPSWQATKIDFGQGPRGTSSGLMKPVEAQEVVHWDG